MNGHSNGYDHTFGQNPVINSWTEFGDLEYVCVGTTLNACYPDPDPCYSHNVIQDTFQGEYIGHPLGPRPLPRVKQSMEELQNLVDILSAEQITVGSIQQLDKDIKQELKRKRGFTNHPKNLAEDKRIQKKSAEVCRPPSARFDHNIQTPFFKNYYQFGNACPRDSLITMGNTILEAPTASRVRYFESNYYRDIIYRLWEADKRVHWKTAPQPTCKDSMYDLNHFNVTTKEMKTRYVNSGYKTAVNESEVTFDAADMMRVGKDIFYKKSGTANNKGIEWLRREFPELRFHMIHIPQGESPHLDTHLIPMRPPTSGSDGVLLINQNYPPLASEMKLFEDNGWRPHWSPLPATNFLSPVAVCSTSLNMNLLSLSTKCCIIEECELPIYHFLEDLGWDVIGVPLRALNEFGGGVHCVTLDIRRSDTCKDYFPHQDYQAECAIDLNQFFDTKIYPN